jgi:hypothetical protein
MPGIVIEQLKMVYWPIPKCVCTSIKGHVAKIEGITQSIEGGSWPHNAAFRWTSDSIPGYVDFALVRNPVDRFCSLWKNKIGPNRNPKELDTAVFDRSKGFHVDMPIWKFLLTIRRIPLSLADPHWLPQTKQVPIRAKWVRMEDVLPLLKLVLPIVNVSPAVPCSLSKKDKENLITYYAQDFTRFGYRRPDLNT